MTVRNNNLFDPIMYILRRLMKRRAGGVMGIPSFPGPPSESEWQRWCLDTIGDIALIRDENGRLVEVQGPGWTVNLEWEGFTLEGFVSECDTGYRIEGQLVRDDTGLLTEVLQQEFNVESGVIFGGEVEE